MKIVRALGDADANLSDWIKVAMFKGQLYEVPDAEAARLVEAGLAALSASADGDREEPQEGSPAPSPSAPSARATPTRRRRNELPNA